MDYAEYTYDDELIARSIATQRPVLDIYRFEHTAVVLGRGSKSDVEINQYECGKYNVPILRRRGGGCAVLLDPGNVIVSVVVPDTRLGNINETFARISTWLIDGLTESGVHDVRREGICDLVTGDRKIAGACMQRKRSHLYYSCSLMFDPDVDLMEKLIAHPPREPSYRKHRIHREFISSIKDHSDVKNIENLIANLNSILVLDTLPGI